MLDTKYLQTVRAEVLAYASKRREVIKSAGDAQHHSKRAIFALQRDDLSGAVESLGQAEKLLLDLNKRFNKCSALFDEGSYRSAVEEYVEAQLFFQFYQGKKITKISKVLVEADTYIGGLCDLPGELYRYAIKSVTQKKYAVAKKCREMAEMIINELVTMDLTGYNRQKFDQAKQAMQKLEQVEYEISLRDKI